MPRRNDISRLVVSAAVFVSVFCSGASALQQSNNPIRKITVVTQCAPGVDHATERTFANPGLKSWQEYSKVEDVPPLRRDTGEQMFAVSTDASGKRLVRLTEFTEDSSTVETLCYDNKGSLRSLKYEIQTEWGWGYSEERLLGPGAMGQRTHRFFDTASNQTIPRPRQADDVPGFLKAKIYGSFDQLPFYALLDQQTRTNAPPQ